MKPLVNTFKVKEIRDILRDRGIDLEITGCGCCDSPSVKLTIDGILLVDDGCYNISDWHIDKETPTEVEINDEIQDP